MTRWRRWPPAPELDPLEVMGLLGGEDGRSEVLAEDEAARRAGLDGVPAFVMGRYLLFTGAVPSDAMAEAFAKAWRLIEK